MALCNEEADESQRGSAALRQMVSHGIVKLPQLRHNGWHVDIHMEALAESLGLCFCVFT